MDQDNTLYVQNTAAPLVDPSAITSNWIVITGGPSTGKTSVIDTLQAKGHLTIPDAAKVLVEAGEELGDTAATIRSDERSFQLKVIDFMQKIEEVHSIRTLTFFDKGIHDCLAYLKIYGFPLDPVALNAAANAPYKKVFLLEPLETTDPNLTATRDLAQRVNTFIFEAYNSYGLTPISVPFMTPTQRAEFILQRVN